MNGARARPPSLPESLADALVATAEDGAELRLYRLRGGRETGPALLWGHANGFPAGGYAPLLALLGREFQVFAHDARGHGGSALPEADLAGHFTPERYARDLALVCDRVRDIVGDAPLHYAAHSFCGVPALRLAGQLGREPWRTLTLFEPPVSPPEDHPLRPLAVDGTRILVEMAARRRSRWESPEAFRRSLGGRPAYAAFEPSALAGHARGALHESGAGDHVLACPPELEAHVYDIALDPAVFLHLDRLRGSATFVAGTGGRDGNPSWAGKVQAACAERAPRGRAVVLEGAGHMVPFEDPARCAEVVAEGVAAEGVAAEAAG